MFPCTLALSLITIPFLQADFQYEDKVNQLAAPWVEANKVNSISIGVVYDGNKVWTGHFGTLTPGGRKADDSTVYEIGSISKVFTSILLADAVTQGKVGLDDSIDKLMPSLKKSNPKVGSSITFKHLSHHMSGLDRMPSNIKPADPTNPFDGYTRKLLDSYMASVKPKNKPNQKNQYSNLAVGLLGDLVARSSGVDYETLIKTRIAKPLGMKNTMLTVPKKLESKFAPPFNAALQPDKKWDFQALAGAGAIRSNIADMVEFIKANLNPPKNGVGQALELAWKQHLKKGKDHQGMGLGWMIAGDGSTRWHNGMTGGYQSMMLISRRYKTGVVLLCNTAGSGTDQLAEQIIQTCMGMKVKPKEFSNIKVDVKTVERLSGKYRMAPGVFLTVKTNDGKMSAQLTGQTFLTLQPLNETEWKYDLVDAKLKFELPAKGSSSKVTLFQSGREMPMKRVGDE